MKNVLKKVACLIGLLLWAGGVICSLIYVFAGKALIPILAVVLVCVMSFFAAKKLYELMTS